MKIEELEAIYEAEVAAEQVRLAQIEDDNDAYDALAKQIEAEEKIPEWMNRCPKCQTLSITTTCARCPDHPKMIPLRGATGCKNWVGSSCLLESDDKGKWCSACKKHVEVKTESEVKVGEVETDDEPTKEDLEADLVDAVDDLDKAMSLLASVRNLLDYLADPKMTTVVLPEDRLEMKSFSKEIDKLLKDFAFQEPELTQNDKAFLEAVDRELEGQDVNRMMDRIGFVGMD